MYIFIDGASDVGDIDIDFVIDRKDVFLEGDFNIFAFFVASLDNLAQLLVKWGVDLVLLQGLVGVRQGFVELGYLLL